MRRPSCKQWLPIAACLALAALCCQAQADQQQAAQNDGELPDAAAQPVARWLDFEAFKAAFGRQYASRSEELARAALYLARACRAFMSYVSFRRDRAPSFLAVNALSDRRPEELRRMYSARTSGPLASLASEQAPEEAPVEPEEVAGIQERGLAYLRSLVSGATGARSAAGEQPEAASLSAAEAEAGSDDVVHSDLRSTGCLNAPKSQGECGSCWVFAAMAMYEFTHCAQTGKLLELSEQYVLDCGASLGLEGCAGGQPQTVEQFAAMFGFELASVYAYKGAELQCPHDQFKVDFKSIGYLRAKEPSLIELKRARFERVLERSPVVVTVATTAKFAEYGGGVADCSKDQRTGLHAMLLIGHGRERGRDYWLFRNSHGAHWGREGHYKLAKESDCLVESFGLVAAAPLVQAPLAELNANYKPEPVQAMSRARAPLWKRLWF